MKFCNDHWSKLKTAISDRGLDKLIAKDGAEVIRRSLDEPEEKKAFEPLMGAHNCIVSWCMDRTGLELFVANEDGSEKCPICYTQKLHDQNCKEQSCTYRVEDITIKGAADDMLAEARRLGLLSAG